MTDQYKKHTHREHILELPDTYIGSTETVNEPRWVFDTENKKMEHKTITFNPGLYKIFDEILVNARDALVKSQTKAGLTPIKHIDVTCGLVDGVYTVSVENDGDGIPIEVHKKENCYNPELIFGHLLTSGNYNKEEMKIWGGKNGYGAKLANIFSTRFEVSTRSPTHALKYTQTWRNNMATCDKPSIKQDKSQKGFVRITFCPDTSRFPGIWNKADLLDDMANVFHTRVLEIAAMAGKDVRVTFNGTHVDTNTFEKFVKLFMRDDSSLSYEKLTLNVKDDEPSEKKSDSGSSKSSDKPKKVTLTWEVAAVLTRTLFSEDQGTPEDRHISFVNGINTRKGGKHVDTIQRHILSDICELASKKRKLDVKPGQIKDTVTLFVNSTIVNPSFDSQTKETLTTPATKFGSSIKLSGKIVEGLVKAGVLDEAQAIFDAKLAREAKKTDGAKKKTLRGLPKLEDALWAGTNKSEQCTLILTEGDSAATSAITGLKVVGREAWGVFPLKGKMLNVKDISQDKFNKNEELTAIKKILGLESGRKYTSVKELRYGRVMVMADQDADGSHIKGLLMNLFHTEWPNLMKIGFICSLATPLLKATKRNEVKAFYNQNEFESWKQTMPEGTKGWNLKYYKGLGTSTPAEAREWFENLHEIKYIWEDGSTDESISLAFSKKRADDRKKWLSTYDPKRVLNIGKGGNVPYSKFINDELIHFSNADNIRSLPHLMDGLKPSQRKILFGCLKRGLKQEVRVAQLAGYVSEHAAYHHGEASLTATIVGMAQTFVGSNNINLLAPVGQFGSRLMGGKDAASARYIHTHIEPIVDALFRKEDYAILKNIEDDGLIVEPETYYPVLPLLAINGCVGIGTGFSTDIPPYNPDEILKLMRERLDCTRESLEDIELKPWWLGFRGSVTKVNDSTYMTKGLYQLNDEKHTITITELPVGTWTKDYKVFLDEIASADLEKGPDAAKSDDGKLVLKGFDDLYNDVEVKFVLYLDHDYYEDVKADPEEFEKRFKLTSTWKTSNMVCFDTNLQIVKYTTIGDLLEAFFEPRLDAYEQRRKKEIEHLRADAVEYDAKARFLRAVLDDSIELKRASDDAIVAGMKRLNLPPLTDPTKPDSVDSYEYLLRMRIDRVKASAIQEAEEQVKKAKEALAKLEKTTAAQLWMEDLADFEKAWQKLKVYRESMLSATNEKNVVKTGIKKIIKKTKE
jgi:DNA topoisomerase-2